MDNVQEIVKGLFANPREVTHIIHSGMRRIIIHLSSLGSRGEEKCFRTEETYSDEEFRENAIRIVSLNPNNVKVTHRPVPEPRQRFNPPNVNVKLPD